MVSGRNYKKVAVVGHIAKDHIVNVHTIPLYLDNETFLKNSTLVSRLPKLLGRSYTDVLLDIHTYKISDHYGYGGRVTNVAYQLSKLCLEPILISEFGEDFDVEYQGFFGGSFRAHLEKAGVKLLIDSIPENIDFQLYFSNPNNMLSRTGIIVVPKKEITNIDCICKSHENDKELYLFGDLTSATCVAPFRPVPTELIADIDVLFITSGDAVFNLKVARHAYALGKRIFWDVGLFGEPTHQYLHVMSQLAEIATYIIGNEKEIRYVDIACEESVRQKVIIHDKYQGTAFCPTLGIFVNYPELIDKSRGSPIGCCDGFAAGIVAYEALHGINTNLDVEAAIQIGLIISATIWETPDVQSGMNDLEGIRSIAKDLFKLVL